MAVSLIYNQILIAVNFNYLSGWTSGGRPNANDHRLLVLADHLHLRDDHLPLPLLWILLDRAAQVDRGAEERTRQAGRDFLAKIKYALKLRKEVFVWKNSKG